MLNISVDMYISEESSLRMHIALISNRKGKMPFNNTDPYWMPLPESDNFKESHPNLSPLDGFRKHQK